MNFYQPQTGYRCLNMNPLGQGQLIQRYSVPVQNAFGPLGEWVGLSMGVDGVNSDNGFYESMDFQTAQSKRRRFNIGTGTDNAAFSSLSIDDKLSHMFDKFNDLEQTNQAVVNIARGMKQTCSQINHMNARMNGHEQFLKLIAYKSIDSEARSRRRNLIFHGLAEMKNEDLFS